MICNTSSSLTQLNVKTERIKVLKVVGERIGQLVVQKKTPTCAVKIDRITAKLGDFTDHLFNNKIVKQGTIIKEVFFVDRKGVLRFLAEEIPFTIAVDIPGFRPGSLTEVQNHLLDIDVDFQLTPATRLRPGCLRQIIVAHILFVAAEWTQLDVVTKISPKLNTINNNQCVISGNRCTARPFTNIDGLFRKAN